MNCGNCGKQFAHGVTKVNKILSSWDKNKEEEILNFSEKSLKVTEKIQDENQEIVIPPEQQDDTEMTETTAPSDVLTSGSHPLVTEEITEVEVTTTPSIINSSTTSISKSFSPQSIPISEALSVVFEIPPLSGRTYSDLLNEENTVFPNGSNISMDFGIDPDPDKPEIGPEMDPGQKLVDNVGNPLDLCGECAETLTLLYNSFKDFTRICKLECEVAKRLEELERSRVQSVQIVTTTATTGTKRGRRKRSRPQPQKRVWVKKRSRSQKSNKGQGQEGGAEDGANVEIKKEIQSEIEADCSDLDLDDLDDGYYMDSLSSSPPDSPVNLDFDAIPRSPRPVRNSSARNKDWSSYYKDEFLDDEDDEEGAKLEEGELKPITGERMETDAEEGGDAETMEMLKNVEVEWEEEADRDYEPNVSDDDDEEYKPDSDLEGLAEEGPRRKRARPGRPPKRKHSSMFKSINRSIRRIASRTPSGNFECLECGKCFAHKKSLERHCRTHTDDTSSVECPTCNKTFSRDDHLKRHRRVVHGEDIPMRYIRRENNNRDNEGVESSRTKPQVKCPICDETFPTKDVEEHVVTHGVENPWKCKEPSCPLAFAVQVELNKHKSVHYERQRVKCDVCSKEFRGSYHMKRHQLSIHHARSDKPIMPVSSDDDDEDEAEETKFLDEQGNVIISIPKEKKASKLFKCQECGKKYAKADKLTEHLICHGIGERYRCEICGREFNHIRSKQRHMFLHSPDNPYKCTQEGCDKGFSRKDHYIRHLQNIHNIDPPEGETQPVIKAEKKQRVPPEKEVQCPHCDKVIKRERLRLHMVIHTGEKRHMCDLCGQKFGLRTTLLTHIQCVHQGVRRYTCTYCGQAFKRSNHLKDHEKLHTDADSKPFVCQVCGKAFRREKNLKSHMICHIGSKDYMCEICGKAFNRIDNMRAHVKTVHQGLCIRKKKQPLASSSATAAVASGIEVEGQATLEGIAEGGGVGVIMKVQRPPPRKRQPKSKDPPPIIIGHSQSSGLLPTTAVLVAVDPSNHPDHQQQEMVQELREEGGEEDSNNSYEPQPRTAILQLAPNQTVINPQNPGQPFQGNFFYQYTYY